MVGEVIPVKVKIVMNKKTNIYRIFGLRRSGNHVLINWLIETIPGNVDFYNNIYLNEPTLRNPDTAVSREGGLTASFSPMRIVI